ncbi:YmdB family metallophosphoesterase [Bounagaea algeriensis]
MVAAPREGTVPVKVVFIGDVVGTEAAQWVASRVPRLREELGADWIIVNGENCVVTGPLPQDGFGLTTEIVDMLLDSGVDAITGGNHSWDGPEVDKVLAYERVVRPVNVDEERGQGVVTLKRGTEALTVVNLLSPTAALPGMHAPQPYPLWSSWQALCAEESLPGRVLVDLHGESPWEKASFATALDGQVDAVLGTHTHDPTLRGHVLPAGTGYVAEVGMTGRLGFTGGGFDPVHFAAALRGEDVTRLPAYELATGPLALGAVLVTLGEHQGVHTIERLD